MGTHDHHQCEACRDLFDEVDVWKDRAITAERERDEARDLLGKVRNRLDCGQMHHTTTWDEHGVGEPCPVVERYQAAIDAARGEGEGQGDD